MWYTKKTVNMMECMQYWEAFHVFCGWREVCLLSNGLPKHAGNFPSPLSTKNVWHAVRVVVLGISISISFLSRSVHEKIS